MQEGTANLYHTNARVDARIGASTFGISQMKFKKWAEIFPPAYLNINTTAKTASMDISSYAMNEDGYVQFVDGISTSYNDANQTYICINPITGSIFSLDITQAVTAYTFVLCRICVGKIYSPYGYARIKVNGVTPTAINTADVVPDNSIAVSALTAIAKRVKLYTLADAWNAWFKGDKFPIAIIGDSTTESTADPVALNTLGTDHTPVNAYCTVLQAYVRAETGNSVMRVYNAGFSSQNAVWSLANIAALITGNATYADTKMVGIRHGINDPLVNATTAEYIDSMRTAMRGIIEWCFANNIQPFLITPQATLIAYPLYGKPGYTSAETTNISLSVIRELADEYNLELVDNYAYTKLLQLNIDNLYSLSPDGLHYGIEGHAYQSGFLFSEFNKEVIRITAAQKVGYSNPEVRSGLAVCSKLAAKVSGYNSVSITTATGTLFKVYVFNAFKYGVTLDFIYTSDGDFVATVNGTANTLNTANHTVVVAGMGLIKIVVTNTAENELTFYGVDIA